MTKEQALKEMKECAASSAGDAEGWHHRADEVLCEFLNSLGHGDLVAEWEKVEKWYA